MYIGGLRTRSGREMIEKYSDELITTAVHGMIPKNRLGREIIKKLFVYKDFGKPHDAQNPIKVAI
jgi:large subunit ribosomal protein L13